MKKYIFCFRKKYKRGPYEKNYIFPKKYKGGPYEKIQIFAKIIIRRNHMKNLHLSKNI